MMLTCKVYLLYLKCIVIYGIVICIMYIYPPMYSWWSPLLRQGTPHPTDLNTCPPICLSVSPETSQDQAPYNGRLCSCSAAPRLWNALVDHLRTPQTVDALKPTFLGELISLNFSLLLFFFFFSNLHGLQVFIFLACSLPVSCSTSGFV